MPADVFRLKQIFVLPYVLSWVGHGWVALIVEVSKYLSFRLTTQGELKLGMMLHQHLGLAPHKERRMLNDILSYEFQIVVEIDRHTNSILGFILDTMRRRLGCPICEIFIFDSVKDFNRMSFSVERCRYRRLLEGIHSYMDRSRNLSVSGLRGS